MSSLPIPTPHINAPKDGFAKTVLMPGDPKRAKHIVDTYLKNAVLVNDVRGVQGYTGEYKGKKVSIMASGMGIPSMGIYSYELFHAYNVDNIIRVGTCGAYTKDLNVFDIILVNDAFSNSSYAKEQNGCEDHIMHSNSTLNFYLREAAENLNIPITIANIHSSDVFYRKNDNYKELALQGYLAVEMESFALFHNANALNKKAACLLTVSDSLVTKEETTSEEREKAFTKMVEIALNSI